MSCPTEDTAMTASNTVGEIKNNLVAVMTNFTSLTRALEERANGSGDSPATFAAAFRELPAEQLRSILVKARAALETAVKQATGAIVEQSGSSSMDAALETEMSGLVEEAQQLLSGELPDASVLAAALAAQSTVMGDTTMTEASTADGASAAAATATASAPAPTTTPAAAAVVASAAAGATGNSSSAATAAATAAAAMIAAASVGSTTESTASTTSTATILPLVQVVHEGAGRVGGAKSTPVAVVANVMGSGAAESGTATTPATATATAAGASGAAAGGPAPTALPTPGQIPPLPRAITSTAGAAVPAEGAAAVPAAAATATAGGAVAAKTTKGKKKSAGRSSSRNSSDSYSRKDKSLGLLCENFLKLYLPMERPASTVSPERMGTTKYIEDAINAPPGTGPGERHPETLYNEGIVCLDAVAKELGVERRRIYDVVNVLESVDVVSRKGKNKYAWRGLSYVPLALVRFKRELLQLPPEQATPVRKGAKAKTATPVTPTTRGIADILGNLNTGQTVPCRCNTPRKGLPSSRGGRKRRPKKGKPFREVCTQCSGVITHEVIDAAKKRKQEEKKAKQSVFTSRKEKSLGILTERFIKLFLMAPEQTVGLEDAAKQLVKTDEIPADKIASKLKTKVRRLYDIANILTSLGLIKKAHFQHYRRPAFRWTGPDLEELPPSGTLPTPLTAEDIQLSPSKAQAASTAVPVPELMRVSSSSSVGEVAAQTPVQQAAGAQQSADSRTTPVKVVPESRALSFSFDGGVAGSAPGAAVAAAGTPTTSQSESGASGTAAVWSTVTTSSSVTATVMSEGTANVATPAPEAVPSLIRPASGDGYPAGAFASGPPAAAPQQQLLQKGESETDAAAAQKSQRLASPMRSLANVASVASPLAGSKRKRAEAATKETLEGMGDENAGVGAAVTAGAEPKSKRARTRLHTNTGAAASLA